MAEGNGYIVAAYALTWVVLAAFALRVALGARRSADRLTAARRAAGDGA